MFILLESDHAIIVMTDVELDSLGDDRYLIVTDQYNTSYMLAITDNETQYQLFKRQSQDIDLKLLNINSSQIPELKKGKLINFSDVSEHNIYVSGEGIMNFITHDPNIRHVDFTNTHTTSLQ